MQCLVTGSQLNIKTGNVLFSPSQLLHCEVFMGLLFVGVRGHGPLNIGYKWHKFGMGKFLRIVSCYYSREIVIRGESFVRIYGRGRYRTEALTVLGGLACSLISACHIPASVWQMISLTMTCVLSPFCALLLLDYYKRIHHHGSLQVLFFDWEAAEWSPLAVWPKEADLVQILFSWA